MSGTSIIGKNVSRIDAVQKVTGQIKYLPDINFPGMLYGKILRSTEKHAIIKKIDVTRAKELPGVRAVITGRDVPELLYSFDQLAADKEILCKDKVRFLGDEVAAVAADTEEIAEKALKLIDVEYEPLPTVFDPEDALQGDSVLVHEEKGTNVAIKVEKDFGDVEKGFEESDYVFEDRFVTSRQAHCCLETRGCIAEYHSDGKVTIWAPTQIPHRWRKQVADATGIDRGKIRIINTPTGGAFGSKVVLDTKVPIAVYLSKFTKRPVKMVNSREDEFNVSRTRYPFIIDLKTGVTKDGKILAKQARVIADNGAYCDEGAAVLGFGGVFYSVLYDAPNVSFHASCVYTNNQPCTAFRGFGNPQMHYAFETHLDRIGFELGIDPKELRLRNANKEGVAKATKANINSCTFNECIEEATKLTQWDKKYLEFKETNKDKRIKKGIGMATMLHTGFTTRFFGFNATDTFIKLSDDGIVSVITPIIEMGQGSSTGVAQIVAETLGVKMDDIRIINTDTDITPYDLGAYGSRHTVVCGHAAMDAALKAKEELLVAASEMLNCEAGELDSINGEIFFKNDLKNPLATVGEVTEFTAFKLGRLISARGRFVDELAPRGLVDEGYSIYIPTYSFGCQVAEVEVDTLTGAVKVGKITVVVDNGRTLNPTLAEGQMEGAVAQGMGYALTEELKIEEGQVINNSFTDYKIMHAEDLPEIEVKFVESGDPFGPYSVKGIGECGLVPTAGAITNAVQNATGILIKDLPVRPEKILMSLENQNE